MIRLDPTGEFGFLETGDSREIYFHKNRALDGALKIGWAHFPHGDVRGSKVSAVVTTAHSPIDEDQCSWKLSEVKIIRKPEWR